MSSAVALNFSRPHLVGRAAHQQKLRDAFSRVASTESPSETLLVHGTSGTGKSTLIVETLQEQCEAIGFFFVQGKFDQLKETARPFSAFSEAVAGLCDTINRTKSGDERVVLLQEIKNALGDDAPTLTKLVPKVAELRLDLLVSSAGHDSDRHAGNRRTSFGSTPTATTRKTVGLYSSERAVNIFRNFFRAVCQPYCPVTLFLDDLHNADSASIELFKALSTDSKTEGLLLLASYRDNEVTDELNACLKNIRKFHKNAAKELGPEAPIAVTQVAVEPIDGASLHEFICHTLQRNPNSRTQELADEVMKKTEGNCFFVIQFMLYLEMRGYLLYDLQKFVWTWDLKQVKQKTDVSDNVVEIVLDRIHMLPPTAQLVLLSAAYLGSTFDPEILAKMLHEEKHKRPAMSRLGRMKGLSLAAGGMNDDSSELNDRSNNSDFNGEESKHEILSDSMNDVSGNESSNSLLGNNRDPMEALAEMPSNYKEMRVEVEQQMDLILDFGLLQRASGSWYKFRHDRIQQAAYGLIPEGKERDAKHLRIGRMMRQSIQDEQQEQEWILFAAVDHLNLGCLQMTETDELVDLASLNLKASEKAGENSAIFPAANYAFIGLFVLELSCGDRRFSSSTRGQDEHLQGGQQFALGMLGTTTDEERTAKWKRNYNLALDLACVGAEMSYCVGKFQLCREISDEVLASARSLPDKLRVHLTRIDLAGSQGNLRQAVSEGKQVLEKLGEKFPTSQTSSAMMTAVKNTKKVLKGKTEATLKSMPDMTSSNTGNVMKLMSLVSTYADLSQDSSFMQLGWYIMLRMVEITVKEGFCEYTPVAFAGYGIIMSQLESIEAGTKYGKLALELVEKCAQSDVFAQVQLMVQSSLNHWRAPLALTLEPLLQSYNVGMKTGEVEDALLCVSIYAYHYFYSGLPLGPLTKDLEEYLKLMIEYKQTMAAQTVRPLLQLSMNLQGRCRIPRELDGQGMRESKFKKEVASSGNSLATRNYLLARLQIAVYFGYTDEAKARLDELNAHPDSYKIKALFSYCQQTFFEALVLIEQLRKGKTDLVKGPAYRNNKAALKKVMKRLEGWVETGGINCKDLLLIARAEAMSLEKGKSIDDKVRAYEQAITTASRHGNLQLRAFVSERAGKFLNAIKGYEHQAQAFMMDARDLYKDWGAQCLVDKLEAKHSFLANMSSANISGAESRNFRGRQRYNKLTTEQHHSLAALRLPTSQR